MIFNAMNDLDMYITTMSLKEIKDLYATECSELLISTCIAREAQFSRISFDEEGTAMKERESATKDKL